MSDEYKRPYCPRGLKAGGRALFARVADEWELESDSEEIALLTHACESQDILDQAQLELNEAGSLTYQDRFGVPKERPELRIIRQQRAAVASLIKQIGQAQMSFQRLELATARQQSIEAQRGARRDRRGGGTRIHT